MSALDWPAGRDEIATMQQQLELPDELLRPSREALEGLLAAYA